MTDLSKISMTLTLFINKWRGNIMPKKKKLVDNFQEIIDSGDFESFKKVFDKCEITATSKGKTTCNAFSYRNLTPEHIQFLIDNGLEVNADCGFGYPAVAFHAANRDNLKCLLKNGADINYIAVSYRGSALTKACSTLDAQAVRNLLEENASIDVPGGIGGITLLDATLAHCDNIYISKALDISKMLLGAGASVTDRTVGYVQKIGERFEFFRDRISKDHVDELSDSLNELYELFGVAPVARRVMHDGTSKIAVIGNRWQDQYNELWDMLVPGNGKAQTIQGEMIRIVGRVTHEILDNGGLNWDDDYREMVRSLREFLNINKGLESELVEEAGNLTKHINLSTEKKDLYRLTELVVQWVLPNQDPLPLEAVKYKR